MRLAVYVGVTLAALSALFAWAIAESDRFPGAPPEIKSLASGNAQARAAQQQLEQEQALREANAAACSQAFDPLLGSLDRLNTDLDVGLSFAEYSDEVTVVNRRYHDAVSQLDSVTPTCVSKVGSPAEKALNAYISANNQWNSCISDFNCDTKSIEPSLQRHWAKATTHILRAQTALQRLLTNGDPGTVGGAAGNGV